MNDITLQERLQPQPMPPMSVEEKIDLLEYWRAISKRKWKVVSIEEIYSQGLIQREYYQTQVEILKSEDLARKVVQKLKLTTHSDFDPRQRPADWWTRLTGPSDDVSDVNE